METQTMSSVKQYLTFLLDEEIFAFDVMNIKEVIDYPKVTKLPNSPVYMEGIINLRGRGVPVIDLRVKFGIEKIERTVDTSIIIVEVEEDGGTLLIGALVDAVREVIKLDSNELEPAPKLGMAINSGYIKAIGKLDESFIIILNMARVFSDREMEIMQEKVISAPLPEEDATDKEENDEEE